MLNFYKCLRYFSVAVYLFALTGGYFRISKIIEAQGSLWLDIGAIAFISITFVLAYARLRKLEREYNNK